MDIPLELKKEIITILSQSDLTREASHAENTLHWVKTIKPSASLALQIAAIGHDIERGVTPRHRSEDFENHSEYKKSHSNRSAEILDSILNKYSLDSNVRDEVKSLVQLHEIGGTEDADVLRDADSISFFDNNLEFYYSYKGPEGTRKQMEYKYNRCSKRAQNYIDNLEVYQQYKNILFK